jgi:hypothetical protein
MSRLKRYVLDVTNEEHEVIEDKRTGRKYLSHHPRHHINGYEVRIYAMWHHEPKYVPARVQDIECDKWMVKVTDLDDPRRNFEYWFDHRFTALVSKKKSIDYLRGLIKRKILVEIAKRVVKRSEIPHARGAQLPVGKTAIRQVAQATKPLPMIQVSKRTRIFAGGNFKKRETPALPIIDLKLRSKL